LEIAQANLNDYAGNWVEPFIKVLIDKNIIVGYPDDTFKPDQNTGPKSRFAIGGGIGTS
jgi:S-layer homology domain